MKSSNPKEIKEAFDQLFNSFTEEEKIESNARLIMYRFLSIIEEKSQVMGLNRKQLAFKIGTSPSYITQLYRGDKMVNLITLAKFQKALDLEFDIAEKKTYEEAVKDYPSINDGSGFWVYFPFKVPDYQDTVSFPEMGKCQELGAA